jgi:hypothetical protein
VNRNDSEGIDRIALGGWSARISKSDHPLSRVSVVDLTTGQIIIEVELSDKGVTCCEGCGAPRRSCWRRNWRRFHSSPAWRPGFPTGGGPAGGRPGGALLLRPGVIKTVFVDGLRFRLRPPENVMSLFTKFVLTRGLARPARNSTPNAATAVQSASIGKASGNHASRDEHRAQRSQEELAKMMKAHLGSSLESVPNPTLSEKQTGHAAKDGQSPGAFRLWLPAA